MRDTNNINFGNRGGAAGFGNPPTNSTASLGDGKCYKLTRAYELVLTRNPTVGLIDFAGGHRCNWNISWSNNSNIEEIPIGGMGPEPHDGAFGDPPHCSELNCPEIITETGPTTTVTDLGGGGVGPTSPGMNPPDPFHPPHLRDICKDGLPSGLVGGSKEYKIKWKYKKIVTGCSDVIHAHIWPFSVDVGNLWNIANDLFCAPQVIPGTDPDDLEGDAEETWRKILECLCKIEMEDNDSNKEKMEKNLFKHMDECAKKWNKKASPKDQKTALYGAYAAGPLLDQSDETIEDLTSIKYQECLSEIDDFCAD